MASASRRFLFETIEPRVLLSADLAPTATVHTPDTPDMSLLSLPPVAPLYAPAADVRVLPDVPAPQVANPQTPSSAASDVVAASFTLHVEGAGDAVGSYQFDLRGAETASNPLSSSGQNAPAAMHVTEGTGFGMASEPPTGPLPPPASNSSATGHVPEGPGFAIANSKPIVFIDSALPDYDKIVRAVSSGPDAVDADIVVLDSTKSEIGQITDTLAARTGVTAVHIFSHGFEASVGLGATQLDLAGLNEHADELSSWRLALQPGADILLYGCDIGAGDDGSAFISRFSELTGANVAASTDDTGGTQQGGNWILETSTGPIEATLPASEAALASYDHLLATVQWTGGGDGTSWSDARNWSTGLVPGTADSVSIAAAAGDPAIAIGSAAGVVKIASLSTARPITISSGATLQAGTIDMSRNVTLAGGTIQGGTMTATNGAVIAVSADNTVGNLVGVTVNGDVMVTGANAVLRVSNGLTLNGTMHVAGASTQVRSLGDQTFAGSGTISFEGTTGSIRRLTIEGTSTLTLGSAFKVVGGYSSIGDYWESGGTKNSSTTA